MPTLLDHRGIPTWSIPPQIDPPAPVARTAPESAPTEKRRSRGRVAAQVLGVVTLILVVAIVAVALPHLGDGTGDHTDHPRGFDDLESEYSFGIGSLTVDLRDVDFPAGVHTVAVDLGIGSAEIWLPTDVDYQIRGDLDIGNVDVLGNTSDGFGNTVNAARDVGSDATVVLDVEAQIGHAQVRRG
ncbi:MAG: hypothetical protein DHS20C19_13610 [Acidimicrobiales bacterium]|nr:MAG: hypothetical protein DHS20C19_13610 [Acidimicrobiales bacterium]